MTVYRSKVDVWLMALVFVPFAWAIVESTMTSDYGNVILMLAILAAVVILLMQIKYVIGDGLLKVKAGLFGTQKIKLTDIRSVKRTCNPLSAPALSINRLEIKYGQNYDYVLISPQDRERFIGQLKESNPDIEISL